MKKVKFGKNREFVNRENETIVYLKTKKMKKNHVNLKTGKMKKKNPEFENRENEKNREFKTEKMKNS